MKYTGINRHIDDLGRIVIPMEIRKRLLLSPYDTLIFTVCEDGSIRAEKFWQMENMQRNISLLDETILNSASELNIEKITAIREHLRIIQDILKGTTKAFE